MNQTEPESHQSVSSNEALRDRTPIDRVLEKLRSLDLPAKDHFENYLRYKRRANHKPKTIESSFTSIMFFLQFYRASGRSDIAQLQRSDLEAFIEHEQYRGMHVSTIKTRTASIVAFLHFLMDQDILSPSVLKKTIRLKLPDALPRAMNPKDVRRLIEVIDNARDRALILLLLRTGMRIGEVLGLTLNDLDLKEKKVHLMEGEKNNMGRAVYLSNDAVFALKRWLATRDKEEKFIFCGQHGRLCYSAARSRFMHYIKKARLEHKGYTVHCLRHTFASELLNAGMRLEVLQQLLGHQDIEVTRRYARLTDKTREEEYFRAMAIIEKGGIDGDY
jgi:site-specific recombinase XerD